MTRILSRRSFLKDTAVLSGTVLVPEAGGPASAAPVAGGTAAGAQRPPMASAAAAAAEMSVPLDLLVNGELRTLRLPPQTTLAEALRGPLALTVTKVACDRGACSACTVWLDGQPVCSCMTLALDAQGHAVTTIEGLAPAGDALHPVQQAFIEHDGMQCGFCTPGMVMSCAALHRRDPHAGDAEVRQAISGHLCRCGSYPHVLAAMASLAASGQR